MSVKSSNDKHLSANQQKSQKFSKYFLLSTLPLSCLLCAIDLGMNITHMDNTDSSTIVFTLMDAIIFSVLTAVLTLCTIQLFALLRVLRHTSRREKWLIGAICALFTASYLSRSVYLIYEVFAIDM